MSDKVNYCSEKIFDGRDFHRCVNKGKFFRNGKYYCGKHDPVSAKQKRDKRYVEHQEKAQLASDAEKRIELDASRYRWLRDNCHSITLCSTDKKTFSYSHGDHFDEKIDAAMAKDKS